MCSVHCNIVSEAERILPAVILSLLRFFLNDQRFPTKFTKTLKVHSSTGMHFLSY